MAHLKDVHFCPVSVPEGLPIALPVRWGLVNDDVHAVHGNLVARTHAGGGDAAAAAANKSAAAKYEASNHLTKRAMFFFERPAAARTASSFAGGA